jgi:erythronate-4-phosphate dehydrogenase
MKIVADENIPYVKQAFSSIDKLQTLPARQINAESIRDADILLVRSPTRVDGKLLEGSSVKFVATATIGTDHIDEEYLKSKSIGFASAAGSNANSVAEYVFAAILTLSRRMGFRLQNMTLGVVGVGNIGSKVVPIAEALGMKVLQNDPPLKRKTDDPRFLPLDRLMEADIITLHVPLTDKGLDATYHLFDAARISKMKHGNILINTSRGAVVLGKDLKIAIKSKHLACVVLDVWENEPTIDTDILQLVDLATPHIAGYSFDGKVNGTAMIYKAVCGFLGIEPTWDHLTNMPEPQIPVLNVAVLDENDEDVLNRVIKQVYDIEGDDERFREILNLSEAEQSAYFDQLRREYPIRREFFNTKLRLSYIQHQLENKLAALGFHLANS